MYMYVYIDKVIGVYTHIHIAILYSYEEMCS